MNWCSRSLRASRLKTWKPWSELVTSCEVGVFASRSTTSAAATELTRLVSCCPDFLKLDRSLVQGVQGSQIRLALLQALISMAQRLGCAIIAEGLERAEDIAVCCEMGVHFGQGYYFGHPAPEPALPRPLPPQHSVSHPARTDTVRLQDFVEPIPTLPLEVCPDQARNYFREAPGPTGSDRAGPARTGWLP